MSERDGLLLLKVKRHRREDCGQRGQTGCHAVGRESRKTLWLTAPLSFSEKTSESWRCPLRPVDLVDDALCIGHGRDQASKTAQHDVEVREDAVAD